MPRNPRKVYVCFFVATLIRIPAAHAEPITYIESVAGDLLELPTPLVLPFDVGVNTVSGRLGTVGGVADFDSIAFSIPSGAQLNSVGYSFATTLVPGALEGFTGFYLVAGQMHPDPSLGFQGILASGPSPEVLSGLAFAPALPLGSGAYGIAHVGMSWSHRNDPDPGGFFQDYTWSFTIGDAAAAPVPEPASLSLLGVGAAVLAFRHRRRRRGL